MEDNKYAEVSSQQLEIVEANLEAFRSGLLKELTAATEPITPRVAFKVLIYREALSWRVIELGEGAAIAIKSGNPLSAIILTRALVECAAAYHFLCKKLERCVEQDSVSELDETAKKLILGSRWKDWEFSATNILTMIDGANRDCPGLRKNYDDLSEYCHPNYSGLAMIFSNPTGKFDVSLGRYVRGTARLNWTATNSMSAALMLFEHYYNSSADLLPKIIDLCHRDLETNLNASKTTD